tara:strand:- start:226 stop:543 length:318 start_codon:yes stop_codon:yes gene_type:complete
MAYKWPNHDPDEVVDYSVDWSRFLGDDTIATVVWKVNGETMTDSSVYSGDTSNGLTLVQPTNTTTVATVRFTAGVVGTKYTVTCQITTAASLTYQRTIFLTVRQK